MFRTSFTLLLRQKTDVLIHCAFIILAWFLMALISRQGPLEGAPFVGFFWLLFLFSLTLSLDQAFQEDREDGTLELLTTEPRILELFLLTRLVTFLCLNGLYVFLSFGFFYMFTDLFSVFMIARALVMLPGLVCLFLFVRVLCLSHQTSAQLLPLLVWPVSVSFFLFASAPESEEHICWILGALSSFLGVLCFWGMRFALRFL